MKRLELLYRLQEMDAELDVKRRRLQEVEASLGETDELRQVRTGLQQAEEAYRQWKATLQDLEFKMAALETKITNSENRLYSGTIKNPKELGNLQEEVAYLRRRKSGEEDKLLEAMIGVEEHEAAWKEAQAQWEIVEAAWTANQTDLAQERKVLSTRLTELSELRSDRQRAVAEDDFHLYEDLRRRKGGTAVARLQRNLCLCCHVEVPSSLAQQARQGDMLVSCGSCGRILYAGG